MRHRIYGKKLSRTSSHRKSLLSNLASDLLIHDQIKTTLAKAKFLKPYVEKIITRAKLNTLASRRYILSQIKKPQAISRLIDVVSKRGSNSTRILKSGFRYGDGAPMAYIELVNWEQDYKK